MRAGEGTVHYGAVEGAGVHSTLGSCNACFSLFGGEPGTRWVKPHWLDEGWDDEDYETSDYYTH